jgi:hypothetical protein
MQFISSQCTIKPDMPNLTISHDLLRAALNRLQLDKQRIDSQIAEVQSMLDGGSRETASRVQPVSEETLTTGRRKRSAAVRRRMAEAQRARWAKIKKESVSPETPTQEAAPSKRKKFSAAARKRMAEGQRLRYLKLKGKTESESASPEPAKAKRKMSAAARKAIGEATRKRWALKKAAEAAKSAPAKKNIQESRLRRHRQSRRRRGRPRHWL